MKPEVTEEFIFRMVIETRSVVGHTVLIACDVAVGCMYVEVNCKESDLVNEYIDRSVGDDAATFGPPFGCGVVDLCAYVCEWKHVNY